MIAERKIYWFMKREELVKEIKKEKYNFLKENKHLGSNIILLTLGGSRAYGTNSESSDWDWRGCALNTKMQILNSLQMSRRIQQFIHLIN